MVTTRILRLPDVMARTGLAKATIYSKGDPRRSSYDPTFPKRISLGAKASGWSAEELEAWIASRLALRKGEG